MRVLEPTLALLACLVGGGAPVQAQQNAPGVDARLEELSTELVHARFSVTGPAVEALLARDDLTARQRNTALEILTVTQIALGDPRGDETLHALYRRDPQHRLSNPDLGPQIQAAFARAREQASDTVEVSLGEPSVAGGTDGGSPVVTVPIDEGAGAVSELVLSYREEGAGVARLVMTADGPDRARARLPLLGGDELRCFVEARAPSGAVLARLGSADAPLSIALPRAAATGARSILPSGDAPVHDPESEPGILESWWLWTAVGLVIAGGVAGYFLLGPPSQGPDQGTLGQGTLR